MTELEDITTEDIKKALVQLRIGPGINEDVSEEYDEATSLAITFLEQELEIRKKQTPRGIWINKEYDSGWCSAECSICGERAVGKAVDTGSGWSYSFYKYCHHCGAEMEGMRKAIIIMSPTVEQATNRWKEFISSKWSTIITKANKANLYVELLTGHKIYFKGKTQGQRAILGLCAEDIVDADEFVNILSHELEVAEK